MKPLYIATQNPHKLEEFSSLLSGMKLLGIGDIEGLKIPPETGSTFLDNAVIKARAVAEHTGGIALADDSGLVVDALDGAPGIYSARYVDGTDEDRYRALLSAMRTKSNRSAKFVACLAVVGLPLSHPLTDGVNRQDDVVFAMGEVKGQIAYESRGENGFGYDPIFELPDTRTMAQVSPAEKRALSHRASASAKLHPLLRDYFS